MIKEIEYLLGPKFISLGKGSTCLCYTKEGSRFCLKLYPEYSYSYVKSIFVRQLAGYKLGIAPKPKKIIELTCGNHKVYGYISILAEEILKREDGTKLLEDAEKYFSTFKYTFVHDQLTDMHLANIGYINNKLVIIDWGE